MANHREADQGSGPLLHYPYIGLVSLILEPLDLRLYRAHNRELVRYHTECEQSEEYALNQQKDCEQVLVGRATALTEHGQGRARDMVGSVSRSLR